MQFRPALAVLSLNTCNLDANRATAAAPISADYRRPVHHMHAVRVAQEAQSLAVGHAQSDDFAALRGYRCQVHLSHRPVSSELEAPAAEHLEEVFG